MEGRFSMGGSDFGASLRRRTRIVAVMAASLIVARARVSAAAETPAEALFEEARKLMVDGRYAEACPKLAESERLDPGIGTEFNLARCYELEGRLASAWTAYRNVAVSTHAAGQTAREALAHERVKALEP